MTRTTVHRAVQNEQLVGPRQFLEPGPGDRRRALTPGPVRAGLAGKRLSTSLCQALSQQHCTPTPRGGPGSPTCAPPRRSPGATPAHDSDKAHAAQPGNTERVRAAARSTGGCQPPPGPLLRRLPGPSELWVCRLPPTLWSALHDQVQQFTGKKKNRPEGLLVTCQPILPNGRLGAKRPGSASSEAKPSVASVSTSPAAWAPASLLPPLPAEVALPLLVLGAQAPVGGRSDPETPSRNTHLQGCRSPRR